jgi:hypothetical protein
MDDITYDRVKKVNEQNTATHPDHPPAKLSRKTEKMV